MRDSASSRNRLYVLIFLFLAIGLGFAARQAYWKYRGQQIEALRSQAKAALEADDWPGLEQYSRTWLEWDATAPHALLYLGEARLQQGDPAAAAAALQKIPDDSEEAYPGLLICCDLQFGPLNEPLAGVKTLQRLNRIKRDSTAAHQRLIFFYGVTLQRNKMIDAIHAAIRARAEPPEVYVYLMIADHLSFTDGFSRTEKWLSSQPDSEILQVARILQLMDRLNNSETPPPPTLQASADRQLQEVIAKYPGNLAILRYQLEAASKNFDIDKVHALLAQSPPAADEDSVIWRYRGWAAAREEQYQQAEKFLAESLKRFPLDWQTWNELATVLRRLGRLEEAERAAKIALEGKDLRKQVIQLPAANDIDIATLMRVGNYAQSVGAQDIADQILRRFQDGQVPGSSDAK